MLNILHTDAKPSSIWFTYTAIGIVLTIFCIHAFTLSEGSQWGDDWAMYVNHAYSLARGKGYLFPGYIFNPMYPTYAPTNYPAGYPLLLFPVVAIWGLNLTALKIFNILLLAASLFGFWIWLRPRIHPVAGLILILLVGTAPFYFQLRDQLISDIPYFAVSVGFFLCYDRMEKNPSLKIALVVGVLLFLTYAVRTAGIFLILAFAAHWMFSPPRLRKFSVAALISCAVLVLIHNGLIPSGSYFTMTKLGSWNMDPFNQLYNGMAPYVASLGSFLQIWDQNGNRELGYIVTAMITVLIPAGLLSVRKWTILESYICLHLLAIAFFPGTQGFRYLVGFFPFLLYYAFDAVARIPMRNVRIGFTAIMLVMLILHSKQWYLENYTRVIDVSITDLNAQTMFRFIREQTPTDAVVIADKPRAVSLFTDRKATVYPDSEHEKEWLQWLHKADVSYAVKMAWDKDVSWKFWARYIDANPAQFTRVFEHTGFEVYKVHRDSIPQ